MLSFREYLQEVFKAEKFISNELHNMQIPHRFERGTKHNHAVISVQGKEHRFPFSHGGSSAKREGNIQHAIRGSLRRFVRQAQGA